MKNLFLVSIVLFPVSIFLNSCFPNKDKARGMPVQKGDRILFDFEDDAKDLVSNRDYASIVHGSDNVISGKRSLKLSLSPGPYPGISMPVVDGNWKDYSALAFECINNTGKAVPLSIRIDDKLSRSYGTRFNLERWIKLQPGRTSCVLPLAALELGAISHQRGLDLSQINKLIFMFLNLKEPLTIFFDDIRLLRRIHKNAPQVSIIPERITGAGGAKVTKNPDGSYNCNITKDCGPYPGIKFKPSVTDWLGYDYLEIRAEASRTSRITIKVVDRNWRGFQCYTMLDKEKGVVRMPLHIIGLLDLTRIKEFVIFFDSKSSNEIVFKRLDLCFTQGLKAMETSMALPEGTRFVLDCSACSGVGRNTGFAFFAYPPGRRALIRGIRDRNETTPYVIELEGLFVSDALKIPVASYFFDHGICHFASSELDIKPGGSAVFRPSARDFAH